MKKLLWLDLEMTGLDENKDKILEVAAIVTNLELKTIDSYESVFFQPPEVLAEMNDWCKKTHKESGLVDRVPTGKQTDQVESDLISLIEKHFKAKDRVVIAGNSIHNDRRFIDRYLSKFASRLHYRMIDVSSYKEIFRERYGMKFEKRNSHRAIEDIHESIRELSYYLSFIVIPDKKSDKKVSSHDSSK